MVQEQSPAAVGGTGGAGSNPAAPTNQIKELGGKRRRTMKGLG
jgi:hypothetical protein